MMGQWIQGFVEILKEVVLVTSAPAEGSKWFAS